MGTLKEDKHKQKTREIKTNNYLRNEVPIASATKEAELEKDNGR